MHFVLVHGSWHGGWCWDGVVAALAKAGHTADAPTLPGCGGEYADASLTLADLAGCVDDVVEDARAPTVLVGHSSAGLLLQAVAPRHSRKLVRVVALSAIMVPTGQPVIDLFPPEMAKSLTAEVEASGNNTMPVNPDFIRNVVMAGESDADKNALLSRLSPQPFALYTTRIDAKPFAESTVPRSAIVPKGDLAFGPGGFIALAKAAGVTFDRVVEPSGGHEIMVTAPAAATRALLDAVPEAHG